MFRFETDAEVVVHLLERHDRGDLVGAVEVLINADPRGASLFSLSWTTDHLNHHLFGASEFSVRSFVGVGKEEMFIVSPIVMFLRDPNVALFSSIEDGEVVSTIPDRRDVHGAATAALLSVT